MYTAVVFNFCRSNLERGGRRHLCCQCQMVVNHWYMYVSYMAQMAVDSTSHEFKRCTSTIFVKKFMCSIKKKKLSLEIGDKMLCSTHIHICNSIYKDSSKNIITVTL